MGQREWTKTWQKKQKQKGLCRYCTSESTEGTFLCSYHTEKRRVYSQRYRNAKKRRGECALCHEKICEGSTIYCTFHHQENKENSKFYKNKRKLLRKSPPLWGIWMVSPFSGDKKELLYSYENRGQALNKLRGLLRRAISSEVTYSLSRER